MFFKKCWWWCDVKKIFLREINYYVFWNVTNHFFKVTCPFFPWKKKSAAVFTLTKRFMILTTNGSRSRIRRTLFDTTHYELKLGNIDFCPQKKFKKQQKMNIFGHKITQDFFLDWNHTLLHLIVHCGTRRTLFDFTPYCFNDSVES